MFFYCICCFIYIWIHGKRVKIWYTDYTGIYINIYVCVCWQGGYKRQTWWQNEDIGYTRYRMGKRFWNPTHLGGTVGVRKMYMNVLKKPSHSGFSGSIFPRKSEQLMLDVKHHTYTHTYIYTRVKSLNYRVLQEGYSIYDIWNKDRLMGILSMISMLLSLFFDGSAISL